MDSLPASKTTPVDTKPLHVLVVDDHPNTANMLARAITQMSSSVEAVAMSSGLEAFEHASHHGADILITDMVMPGMTGLELVEKLQAQPGSRPAHVILITAYEVPGLKETARRLKVNEILAKPVRPERICQIIAGILKDWEGTRHPATHPVTNEKRFKILVADDHADNITLLGRYLHHEGYEFLTAGDGIEALTVIRDELPDLVLLDVNMPNKDGFSTLEEIRADPDIKHIPVIILTAARLDPLDVQSGLNLGADDYVTKPFDRHELMARIRTKLRVKETEDHLRRRDRELNILPEIGKDLSARLDMNELAVILLKRTVETLGALMGYLVILRKSGPVRHTYYAANAQVKEEIPLPQSLFEIVNNAHQGFIIGDTRTDSRWQGMPAEQIRSAVVVPLFGRHELLGLLILTHEQEDYFTIEHMLLLQAIASQAAIAVENANLFSSIAYEQKRMAAVLSSTADAILVFDADDSLTLVNPAGERLFTDYAAGLGLPLAHGKGYDALIALLEKAYASDSSQTGEVAWPDNRTFAALVTPIEDGGHVVTLHDITRFKELERVKNEFIATASHDLKNPIASITGFSHLLSQAGPLNEQQTEFVERIRSASQNMNELVHNLLQLVQLDLSVGLRGKRDLMRLGDLAARVADEYKLQAAAKGQSLNVHGVDSRAVMLGDEQQLAQVLRNLVGNAIKYTPDGGAITLSLDEDGNEAILRVEDTGYGIPAEELPKIFNRFHRVRDENTSNIEGNGLGLAIVKTIVEQHEGRVSVESEVGKGSCFTIHLPLAAMVEAAPADPTGLYLSDPSTQGR